MEATMNDRGRPRSFDRERALRRAMEVFWAKGYDGASLAELTAAMGINPPSLYAAFGSKEALFREAAALYQTTEGSEIWDSLLQGVTARDGIENFLRASAQAFTRPHKPHGCMIVLGVLHSSEANAAVSQELQDRRSENITVMRERLERASKEGELPRGIDCQAIATFYVTVQQGMSIQARDGASQRTLLGIAHSAMAAWDKLTKVTQDAPNYRGRK
jgi:AcrR family transcriptional regulator